MSGNDSSASIAPSLEPGEESAATAAVGVVAAGGSPPFASRTRESTWGRSSGAVRDSTCASEDGTVWLWFGLFTFRWVAFQERDLARKQTTRACCMQYRVRWERDRFPFSCRSGKKTRIHSQGWESSATLHYSSIAPPLLVAMPPFGAPNEKTLDAPKQWPNIRSTKRPSPDGNLEHTHLPLENVPIRVANGSPVFLYHHRRGGVHLLVVAAEHKENQKEQPGSMQVSSE